MSIDTDHFRTLLEDERVRVKRAIDRLHGEHASSLEDESDELASDGDNHMGDLASDTLNREIDFGLEQDAEHVLAEIDAALARIDDGTYGTCGGCGKEIPAERLEAVPWARLCIEDARKAEGGA
ncbi:MAG: TraR/DksA C4-type zinc finger protein [Actinomycetota bacterium]